MKKMRLTLKPIALALAISITANTQATGIPVVDAASNAQNAIHYVKELAEMANQLSVARNQLTNLKDQLQAMTGFKGFSEILANGGLDTEILDTFEDLLSGDTSAIMSKAEDMLTGGIDCSGEIGIGKTLCEGSLLSDVATFNYIEQLSEQFDKKLEKISALSEKVTTANDVKSMAEIQAAISLEANSIALLQQQTQAFEAMNKTKQELFQKRVYRDISRREFKQLAKDLKVSKGGADYDGLLD